MTERALSHEELAWIGHALRERKWTHYSMVYQMGERFIKEIEAHGLTVVRLPVGELTGEKSDG